MRTKGKSNISLFFMAVYGITALLYTPILLSGDGMASPINTALMVLVTFVPSGMGVLFVYKTRSKDDRRDFWRRVFRWPRRHAKPALAGLLILPFSVFVSYAVSSFVSDGTFNFGYGMRVLTDWKTLIVFLFVELTFGAISEELGWRGYALDELQSRGNALKASLILGILWAFWHTPAFLTPGTSQFAMGGLLSWNYACFILAVTLGSVIHTWVYNNTGGSILVAGILMHFAQNATMIFLGGIFDEFTLPSSYWLIQLCTTAIIAAILICISNPSTLTRRE